METLTFMDPKQRKRQNTTLMIGYVLVGCAVLLLTTILVFVAYGFGFKNGQVIQNGLVFLSSTPHPADVYVDGKRYKDTTNTRIVLPAGVYDFTLKRTGYRNWERSVNVTGGQVESYAYPFLFPTSLTTTTRQTYAKPPALVTESPDRHWLMVARPDSLSSFDIYDLNSPSHLPAVTSLPDGLLSAASSSQSLQLVAWASDNTHVLLKHLYDNKTEYIIFNKTTPAQSVNLTRSLSLALNNIDLRFNNQRYDQYIFLDTAQHNLFRATLGAPQPTLALSNILAFTTYGSGTVLYATPNTIDHSKVDIDLYDSGNIYLIRHAAANTTYLLGLNSYGGDLYVAVSASSENEAYVYKDPASQITDKQLGTAAPARIFSISAPTYVGFSTNGQYVIFEHDSSFSVYDAESQQNFSYTVPTPMDSPQAHAVWMDAARLTYVTNGQLIAFDYDGQNRQTLVSASAAYQSYFDQDYKVLYTLVPSAANSTNELLTATALRTPADQ